ncbi:MAG: hypothetical protein U1D55_15625 [Phycisphaerae bacterium]
MPWSVVALLLVVTFVLQTAVVSLMGLHYADLFLSLALLCGLVMPIYDGRIAAWAIGLVQGLGSQDALGIHALLLGLAAILLTNLRAAVNLSLWWARWLIAFVAAWPVQILYLAYQRFAEGQTVGWIEIVFGSAFSALIAGLFAALVTALPILVTTRRVSEGRRSARRS